jgi:hypothetical protein
VVSSEGPPHSVAFYNTHGDAKDLFLPGSSIGYNTKEKIQNTIQMKNYRMQIENIEYK